MFKRVFSGIRRIVEGWVGRIVSEAIIRRGPYDYVALAYIKAGVEAADFFREHMALAHDLKYKSELLEFVAANADKGGLWLEFGVFQGRDIRILSQYTEATIYGFDSFEGLPEDWTFFQRKGRFSVSGKMPDVPSNVTLIKGWFNETLDPFLEAHSEPISLLHIDSDLYSSAKYILGRVAARLEPGSLILFDDFLNYPDWRSGEYRAFTESVSEFNLNFEFVAFASAQQAVCVRIRGSEGG